MPPSTFGLGTLRATALVIHPCEGELPGKTGEYDHTVTLDLPRQAWLGRLLATRARRASPHRPLFDITPDQFSKLFNQAIVLESLQPLGATPYGLRHGGASHDRATGSRTLTDIQRRGNWRCPNCANVNFAKRDHCNRCQHYTCLPTKPDISDVQSMEHMHP